MKVQYRPSAGLKAYLALSLVVAAGIVLSGCAREVPVNYSPSSVKTAHGAVSVADFRYLPSLPGTPNHVAEKQIRNTALGNIVIDRNVSVFVRDAVFAELRFVGIKMDDPAKVLSADIEDFLIDDLGYSVDWTLRIKYTLTDSATKTVLYQSEKNAQRHTAKGINVFGALNEIIKTNAEEIIDDPDFIKAIN